MSDLPLLLANRNVPDAEQALEDFLARLPHPVSGVIGQRSDFGGYPTVYADIYYDGPNAAPKYDGFGSVFVRAWAIGGASRLAYGLMLGAGRSEQLPARSGVAHARRKLASFLRPFEDGTGFTYQTWSNEDFPWSTKSARSLTRQFEPFITHRQVEVGTGNTKEVLEDLENLVGLMVKSIESLQPLVQFGREIAEAYFLRDFVQQQENNSTSPPAANESEVPSEIRDLIGVEEVITQASAALVAGKNVVLIGPPGTGKTELIKRISQLFSQEYLLTTATSDWTTFDTIGGYMPTPGAQELEFRPGLILQSLQSKNWLLIDELNRADIDKAFGQVFTVLGGEVDRVRLPFVDRQADGTERPITIANEGQSCEDERAYEVPGSWRILATMNTFDKASLYQLSFAFMRRFAFIEVLPPRDEAFDEILLRHSLMNSQEIPASYLEALLEMIRAIFFKQGAHSLHGLGIQIGPAIPLDMLSYIEARLDDSPDDLSPPEELFVEASAAYLFPQFEGRNYQHTELVALISRAIGTEDGPTASIDRMLRTWTGYEGEG